MVTSRADSNDRAEDLKKRGESSCSESATKADPKRVFWQASQTSPGFLFGCRISSVF